MKRKENRLLVSELAARDVSDQAEARPRSLVTSEGGRDRSARRREHRRAKKTMDHHRTSLRALKRTRPSGVPPTHQRQSGSPLMLASLAAAAEAPTVVA